MLSMRPRAVATALGSTLKTGVQARSITASAVNKQDVTFPRDEEAKSRRPQRGPKDGSTAKPRGQRLHASTDKPRDQKLHNRNGSFMLNKRLADKPMSLMTLADLSTTQIATLIKLSLAYKTIATVYRTGGIISRLTKESVALIFNKRSTRTRVASETAITALGGNALFLGKDDIQLGVNESLEDTARIIGSMTAGIMARVGEHVEVEVSSFRYVISRCALWEVLGLTLRNVISPDFGAKGGRPSHQRAIGSLASYPDSRGHHDDV